MSERSVIFTLLMDKPPNGKLPVLSVHSFAVRKRKNDHIDMFMIKFKERMLRICTGQNGLTYSYRLVTSTSFSKRA